MYKRFANKMHNMLGYKKCILLQVWFFFSIFEFDCGMILLQNFKG